MKVVAGEAFVATDGASYRVLAIREGSSAYVLHRVSSDEMNTVLSDRDKATLSGKPTIYASTPFGGVLVWPVPDADYEMVEL